ncbi:MAG: hypothetical protein JRN27_08160 [Nitrososphaerota archaeon]|nr:hypothetical protein [Nitrososphaerota archaeon]MDG6976046.1 hypothetical protein [Nitrososphaerota archaeon]
MTTEAGPTKLKIARRFLEEARIEMAQYDKSHDEAVLRLVCEKVWGAIAQALMHAADKDVTHHTDYQQIANDLKRSKKVDVINAVIVGDRLHSAGFYHGRLSPGAVEDAMGIVGQAVEEIGSKFRDV